MKKKNKQINKLINKIKYNNTPPKKKTAKGNKKRKKTKTNAQSELQLSHFNYSEEIWD